MPALVTVVGTDQAIGDARHVPRRELTVSSVRLRSGAWPKGRCRVAPDTAVTSRTLAWNAPAVPPFGQHEVSDGLGQRRGSGEHPEVVPR